MKYKEITAEENGITLTINVRGDDEYDCKSDIPLFAGLTAEQIDTMARKWNLANRIVNNIEYINI